MKKLAQRKTYQKNKKFKKIENKKWCAKRKIEKETKQKKKITKIKHYKIKLKIKKNNIINKKQPVIILSLVEIEHKIKLYNHKFQRLFQQF